LKGSELEQRRHERRIRGMAPEVPRARVDDGQLTDAEKQQRALERLKEIG
jgi:hypothetical protein